jgi:hypothetical protein
MCHFLNQSQIGFKIGICSPLYQNMPLIKFYSHQIMHFLIQLCTSLLSYIKIT